MDNFDRRILRLLEQDATLSLKEIGKSVGLYSPSAVSKRIDDLKKKGFIKKISATLDFSKLGFNFYTMTFVRGKYGPNYKDRIANQLMEIPGIVSVYFLLGDIDFLLYTVSKDKQEYSKILDRISSIPEIERSDTRTVLQSYREMDFSTVDFWSLP
ncbi:MAG: Lrp/AsnC family transcriptional regulator [Candidatus Micrarchaeaceae archaeon]